MSTKIHNGMLMKSNKISDLFRILKKIEPELKMIAIDESAKFLAKKFAAFYDTSTSLSQIVEGMTDSRYNVGSRIELKENKFDRSMIRIMVEIFNERNRAVRYSTRRDVEYDCNFIISFYSAKNMTLLIPYGEISAYDDVLKKHFFEYPYWNNTDRPDDVTDREWETRSLLWNIAIENPILKYELFGKSYDDVISMDSMFIDGVMKNIEPREIRCVELAKNQMLLDMMKEKTVDMDKQMQTSEWMSIFSEVSKEVKSDAKKEELAIKSKEWFDKIQDIDVDTMLNYKAPKEKTL